MKKLIIAAGLIAIGATSVSAYEGWNKDKYPYAQKYHSVCQDKAQRLHGYEVRAAKDGRLSWREKRTLEALKRDLNQTCGGFRHH